MNLKPLIPTFLATLFAACDIESTNCPRAIEVPFENVEIPDSVEAGKSFTIDTQIHDLGCYQYTELYKRTINDTIFLSAYAAYDECGCPTRSNGLELDYTTSFNTSDRNKTKYYVYMVASSNKKDSIYTRIDSVWLY
jgi:hypothetical protein